MMASSVSGLKTLQMTVVLFVLYSAPIVRHCTIVEHFSKKRLSHTLCINFYLIVQGIFAKIGPDLELCGGDLISSPVDSIVSPVSPKKSYGPNSVGKNYFSATPFSLLAKNATGGHNA